MEDTGVNPKGGYPTLDNRIRELQQRLSSAVDAGKELGSKIGQAASGLGQWKDTMLTGGKEQLEKAGEATPKNKVFRFFKGAAESYLDKFNPAGKDKKAWALGIAGGFGSAVGAAEFGATLGFSPVVRALTVAGILNASDAIYYQLHRHYVSGALDKTSFQSEATRQEVLKRIFELEKDVAAKGLKGEEFRQAYDSGLTEIFKYQPLYAPNSLTPRYQEVSQTIKDKLFKYAMDYGVVTGAGKSLRSLSAGLAAGAMGGFAVEAGMEILGREKVASAVSTASEWIGERLGGGQAPGVPSEVITAPVAGTPTVEEGFLTKPPVLGTAITETSPVGPSEVVAPQPEMVALEQDPQFIEQKAAVIGRYLPGTNEVLGKALELRDLMLASLDTASLEAGQEAMQHQMESKINDIAAETAKAVLSADPNASLADINTAVEKAFAGWLSSEAGSGELAETGLQGIAAHVQVESALSDKVNVLLESSPNLYQEVIVQPKDTLGEILNLTWTAADVPKMGANIAVNYGPLTGAWEQTAANYPNLLSDNPFPVSESEISELVERAEAGDELARRRLVKALHWISNGTTRFRVLTEEGVQRVLQELAGGGSQQVSRLAA